MVEIIMTRRRVIIIRRRGEGTANPDAVFAFLGSFLIQAGLDANVE
jgi:hypothetical protein